MHAFTYFEILIQSCQHMLIQVRHHHFETTFCKMLQHGLSSIKYWLYLIFCHYLYQSSYMKYLISVGWVWVECCGLGCYLITCVQQGCQNSFTKQPSTCDNWALRIEKTIWLQDKFYCSDNWKKNVLKMCWQRRDHFVCSRWTLGYNHFSLFLFQGYVR